jgi:hypothetical protein
MRPAPLSERVCDGVVVVFGVWTMASHAVVAGGGGLIALLLLFAAALIAVILLKLWLGTSPPPEVNEPAVADTTAQTPGGLRIAALVLGVGLALSAATRSDASQLWWGALVLLGLAAVVVYARETPRLSTPEAARASERLLWLLAAAGVGLTLISHRPDADDAFYVNAAVAAADVPGRALLSVDTMHGIPGLPLHLSVYRVQSYELLNGAVAYLTGIPPIYSFHWVLAALAALLVPLAHARLFRILTPRHWLAAVATLLVILVAAGETHRWYGNFAFVRLWQGKSIFLSVFTPLIYAYAFRFALRPNRRDWILLALAQIGAVGCSSSALWAAPLAALVGLASAARPSWDGARTVLLGGLASAYVLAASQLARSSLVASTGGGPTGRATWLGPRLLDALVPVLGDSRLLILGVAVLLTAWVFATPGLARRFAVVSPLVVFVGLLNPFTAVWVVGNVTGPAYWRALWALPLPILLTLMLASPLELGDATARQGPRRATWLVALVAYATLIPRYSGLSPENNVRLGWPALKVPEPFYQLAAAVNQNAPPGSYVAVPTDVGAWVVTFPHHVYPLTVRNYLGPWRNRLTGRNFAERAAIQRFLDSPELVEASPEQFRDGLERFEVRAVCLVSSPQAATARAVLQQAGFHEVAGAGDYGVWVRRHTRAHRRHELPGQMPAVAPDEEDR